MTSRDGGINDRQTTVDNHVNQTRFIERLNDALNVIGLYKRRPIQARKFKKLSGTLQMEFYREASQKHRSTMGQVGIIREKDTEKVATIHWQSKRIGRFHNNIFEAEAYATRLTSKECVYWKTIVVEVGLRYRFDMFFVLIDSKSLKATVDAPKVNKDVKLPRRDIAMVRSFKQFDGINFHFVRTQVMIADCLTKAMSKKDLLGVLEGGILRKIGLTSNYSIKAGSL